MRLVVSALVVIQFLQPDTLDSQSHSPRNFIDFNYSLIYILFFLSRLDGLFSRSFSGGNGDVGGAGSPLVELGIDGRTADGGTLSGGSLPVPSSMSGATGVLSSNST
jgi:hypothetical protein